MKLHVLTLAAALGATLAGAALARPDAGQPWPMRHLDANGDGAIDRNEAAAHPRLAAKFDGLDKNRDGKLDASERPSRASGRGRGHHGPGDRLVRIAEADRDGDGRIGRSEAAGLRRIGGQFAQIDRNGDGYLVRSELQAYHQRMRGQRQAEFARRAEQRFAAADLNRDGRLSKVEVGEKMPRLAKAFAFLDEDRDGYLTRRDLAPPAR
ncbi:EF-hand domain-containing protein [Vulcaniibacterium tengchongense]|uniref:Ca2+-binding EF-hand superfamily protein n=1 Tax=Vulcaniibacterium tengchongense TaxID=1273429 RepID=A0A3N4VVS9_9GAMM|nr:hypothetical protein [Vulcaniibacterium tengchongense]RPE81157.1 Ca2+-binding EF-hand superfamily protein [Vulcaniibacterium tengchongense]